MREILSEPEQKIRLEHSKKDLMLQELKGKAKDKKKELDQAAPEAQETKKLQGFAYEEQLRALKGAEITAWQNYENAKRAREEFQQQNALGKP